MRVERADDAEPSVDEIDRDFAVPLSARPASRRTKRMDRAVRRARVRPRSRFGERWASVMADFLRLQPLVGRLAECRRSGIAFCDAGPGTPFVTCAPSQNWLASNELRPDEAAGAGRNSQPMFACGR